MEDNVRVVLGSGCCTIRAPRDAPLLLVAAALWPSLFSDINTEVYGTLTESTSFTRSEVRLTMFPQIHTLKFIQPDSRYVRDLQKFCAKKIVSLFTASQ